MCDQRRARASSGAEWDAGLAGGAGRRAGRRGRHSGGRESGRGPDALGLALRANQLVIGRSNLGGGGALGGRRERGEPAAATPLWAGEPAGGRRARRAWGPCQRTGHQQQGHGSASGLARSALGSAQEAGSAGPRALALTRLQRATQRLTAHPKMPTAGARRDGALLRGRRVPLADGPAPQPRARSPESRAQWCSAVQQTARCSARAAGQWRAATASPAHSMPPCRRRAADAL